jgi:hypothetical protein
MNISRAALVGVASVIVGFAGGVAAVAAATPQDPALLIGGRATGFVNNGSPRYQNRPVAYYRVECPATWVIQIDATSTWDNILYLFDSSGRNVAFNDDTDWRNARIVYTCPATGAYRVAVGAASPNGQGEFTVAVTRVGAGTATVARQATDTASATRAGELPSAGSPPTSTMQEVYNVAFGEPEKDICWKGSYGRTAGEIGKGCAPGFERTGADLLCYPVCRPGFTGVGPMCWQDCGPGSTNLGPACGKVNGSCPAGMTDVLGACVRQGYGRGVGEGATCGPGQEQDFKGGLCYPKCRPGMNGVGPVCWGKCTGDFPVDCGAGCAVDQTACGFAVFDQVMSTADVVLNIAALVGTGGSANVGLKAAQRVRRQAMHATAREAVSYAERTGRRVGKDELKKQLEERVDSIIKRHARYNGGDTTEFLSDSGYRRQLVEALVQAHEAKQFDFMAIMPQSVADVEPTGALALVAAFNKPLCQPGTTNRTIAALPPRPRIEGEMCSDAARCDVGLRCTPNLGVCQPEIPILGAIRIGQTVQNTLGRRLIFQGRPAEFYRFQCQPGLTVRVAVSSQFDNVAIVADTAYNQLGFGDNYIGTNARLDYTCRAPGEVLVGAGGIDANQYGAYTMTLGIPGERNEPLAGGGATERVVSLGETVQGAIDDNSVNYNGHRLQYFTFQCRAGLGIRAAASSTFDNEVYVFDLQGRQLAYTDDGNGTNARLNFTCPSNSVVRIAAGGWRGSPRGPFTLAVTGQPGSARPTETAAVKVLGTTRIGASVNGRFDFTSQLYQQYPTMFYQFTCPAGRALQIDAGSGFDNAVMVLNTAGALLARDDNGNGTNGRLLWTCPADDAYLVGISGVRRGRPGDDTFLLTVTTPGGGGTENGGGRIVGFITPGQTVSGVIDSTTVWYQQMPVQFYGFQCERGLSILVTMTSAYDNAVVVVRTAGAERRAWGAGGLVRGSATAETSFTCPDNEVYRIGAGAFRVAKSGPFRLTVDRR